MQELTITLNAIKMPLFSMNTLVIGSGAAALNAAVNLVDLGQPDIAIVTEQWGGGTSNNTGSDKQTYYKLSLAGNQPDSPRAMAEDLFRGGCMHGDIALCEAQNSAQAFYHLVNLGVPFPFDRHGAYVGYKTDHDPRQRATSAGPLTSQLMFQHLAADVKKKQIRIFDHMQVVALLTDGAAESKRVFGAIAIDRRNINSGNYGFVIFNAVNVILGTGGPAGLYKTSVYPESQFGSIGMAFAAGAIGQNLTESQFGIASTRFRWNLSGTFQQVIPRYVSTDESGGDEREFLNDFYPDFGHMASAVFLKGYQWPFDPRKVAAFGSSLIDILVYQESVIRGRRVFLDFKHNPGLTESLPFESLGAEARDYLKKSDALFGKPIDRLAHMNQPAIDLYKNHGIDLSREQLQIAVCAQHNNGGLKGNLWWESNIRHLFPVGEVNGTHGVYRPGGSALNAGQVGGLRAAQYITKRYLDQPPESGEFLKRAQQQIVETILFARNRLGNSNPEAEPPERVIAKIQDRMTKFGAHIREKRAVKKVLEEAWSLYQQLESDLRIQSFEELPMVFRARDLCLTHVLYLEAMNVYLDKGGQSRGSVLIKNENGEQPCANLDDSWSFKLAGDHDFVSQKILEVHLSESDQVVKKWVDIRPIPEDQSWFETVWKDFREDRIIEIP